MDRIGLDRWVDLTPSGDVRCLKYSWGPGTANTLAVRQDDGQWLVVSPCVSPAEHLMRDLAERGTVHALIAPNAFHHLGQLDWRARFPEAKSYAPAQALARLSKKLPSMRFEPLDQLASLASVRVRFIIPDGMKTPDLLIRIRSGDECVWWLGELFSNSLRSDQTWWLRLFAKFAGSGSGYRLNSKPTLVYVHDTNRWRDCVSRLLRQDPPTLVVPAHGEVVATEATRRTLALLA